MLRLACNLPRLRERWGLGMGAAQYRAPEYLTRSELPNNINCEVTVLVTPGSRIRRARFVAPRQSLKQIKRAPQSPQTKCLCRARPFSRRKIGSTTLLSKVQNWIEQTCKVSEGMGSHWNSIESPFPKYACTRKSITTVKLSEMPSSQILNSSSNLSSQLSSLFSIAYSLTAHPFLYLRQPCSVTPETSIHLTFLFGQSEKDDAVMLTSTFPERCEPEKFCDKLWCVSTYCCSVVRTFVRSIQFSTLCLNL